MLVHGVHEKKEKQCAREQEETEAVGAEEEEREARGDDGEHGRQQQDGFCGVACPSPVSVDQFSLPSALPQPARLPQVPHLRTQCLLRVFHQVLLSDPQIYV